MKTLLGLDSSATPNEVFSRVTLNKAQYGVNLYLKYPDGTPVPNITITSSGKPLDGGSIVTDEDGHVYLVQDNTSFTASVDNANHKLFIDLYETPSISTVLTKTISAVNLVWQYNEAVIKKTSAFTSTISPKAKTVDVCCVGGGQSGAGGSYTGNGGRGGAGGNGGNITNVMNYTIPSGARAITSAIGAGGQGNSNPERYQGGNTYFKIDGVEVCKGTGGGVTPANGGTGGSGGQSDGDDDPGNSGNPPTVTVFNELTCKASGGGGGGSGTWSYSESNAVSGGFGNTKGGHGHKTASNGSVPGGGGGGGWGGGWSWDRTDCTPGMDGGSGAIFLRFHH